MLVKGGAGASGPLAPLNQMPPGVEMSSPGYLKQPKLVVVPTPDCMSAGFVMSRNMPGSPSPVLPQSHAHSQTKEPSGSSNTMTVGSPAASAGPESAPAEAAASALPPRRRDVMSSPHAAVNTSASATAGAR